MVKRTRPAFLNRLPTESGGEVAPCPCGGEDLRHLLLPYVFGGCDAEQESAVEVHLLECESCFEDLAALGRTRSLLEQFVLSQPALLADRKARRRRHRAFRLAATVLGLASAALAGYAFGAMG